MSILGDGASCQLLGAITRSEEDLAALIGRLVARDDATWLAILVSSRLGDRRAR